MIIGLQKSAGNRTVTAMIQRYDAFEHAKAGDRAAGKRTITVGGSTLTSGEINALADLYGSPDDLLKADPSELKALVALVRRQVAGGTVAESEWDRASGGRYTQLNLKNSPHFAPRNSTIINPPSGSPTPGPDHLTTFTRFYTETVKAIQDSQLESDPVKKQALADRSTATAGFAEHYLMDAFSAGHLFNKDDFIEKLRTNLDTLAPANLTALFNSVAMGVIADKKSKDLLDDYETVDTHYGFHPNFSRPAAFQGLLEQLYKDPDGRQAVYSGLVKVVHDQLSNNPAGAGAVGVDVENKFEKWVLSGDRTLDKSADSQRIITKALEQFRAVLDDLRSAPRSLRSPTEDIAKVTDYFPKPTAASQVAIARMVTKATDAAASGTGAALVDILKVELPSILDALEKRGKIKKA
ncbi:hypothetical protein GCM10022204_36020 [Microlunatus aurantiacus]|uniref:Zinc dependent phospholipase C n=2 Tax=Microlunatus aurantiacus TaxID=446786 RepID=A0ABP7E3F2_9ACTN